MTNAAVTEAAVIQPVAQAAPARSGIDWGSVRAVLAKDMIAIRRSKSIVLPMLIVPGILLVAVPGALAWFARTRTGPDLSNLLSHVPHGIADPITRLPAREQLLVLVNGYLLAPLFLIVPLMVSAVLAADAFAGEKERRTMESLLHLPVRDRDLFLAKVLAAFIPTVALSWIGFGVFALVSNVIGWPVVHRIFVPTRSWAVLILWVAPAVAAFGLGLMVRISARSQTTQEANQLGGAVIMPVIIIALGQATGLLLLSAPAVLAVGGIIWLAAAWLILGGMKRFTRDRIASRL
jgi:ABC-2 type transport system permease protein